jgi:adenylate kinase
MEFRRDVVILLGPPGAGKGTQARKVMAETGLPQISTGEMLRDAAARKTGLGLRAKKVMEAGGLVDDETVNGVVQERIDSPGCKDGFILDGYPRNVVQAGMLDTVLSPADRVLVVELVVDIEALVGRLTARRTCSKCNTIYNVQTHPPKRAGVCDACGGLLVQRSDDTEAVIRDRLETYERQTRPLTEYYKAKDLYRKVDGMGAIDRVSERIVALIRGMAAGAEAATGE